MNGQGNDFAGHTQPRSRLAVAFEWFVMITVVLEFGAIVAVIVMSESVR